MQNPHLKFLKYQNTNGNAITYRPYRYVLMKRDKRNLINVFIDRAMNTMNTVKIGAVGFRALAHLFPIQYIFGAHVQH